MITNLLSLLLLIAFAPMQSAAVKQPTQKTKQQQEEEKKAKEAAAEIEEPITQPLPFASNGLFIFLDQDTETGDKIGVVGHELLRALDQKAGPILASALLLRDIIKQPKPQQIVDQAKDEKDPNAQLYQDLLTHRKEIQDYLATIPSNPSWDQRDTIVTHLSSLASGQAMKGKVDIIPANLTTAIDAQLYQFTPSEWTIKKVNDHVLLLVPLNYVAEIKKKNNFAQYYGTQTFTERELNLGIKIEHLQDVSFAAFIDDYGRPIQPSPGAFLVDSLPSIFITRAEYAHDAKQKPASFHMPQWMFYLIGHGSAGTTIGGITIDRFKELLDFFDTKIVAKLFVYNSCYAAGQSAQNVYQDTKSAWFKTHSFTIVTGALTDAPITKSTVVSLSGASFQNIDFAKKREKPINDVHFDQFLQKVTTENTVNFKNILGLIFPEAASGDTQYIFGTPQIKLPGVEWFNLVNVDDNIVSIGQTLATSRSADQPLDIMTFFGQTFPGPKAILLYANIIPFELIVPTQKMPILVSMIPGDSDHQFAKITANTTLKDFFEAMKPLAMIAYDKTFLIKKLKVTGTMQDGQGETEYEYVLISKAWFKRSLDIQLTNKKNEYFEWDSQNNTLIPGNKYSVSIGLGSAKEQEKREQAEKIRKAQERKLQAMEEGKTPAQAIQEIKEEKKQEEKIEAQKEVERQKEIAKQKAAQEKKEQEEEKARKQEKELIAIFTTLPFSAKEDWSKAGNKVQKNEAVQKIGKDIMDSLSDRKKSWIENIKMPKEQVQEHLLLDYEDYIKAFKSLLDKFAGEYDPAIRKEIEQKLDEFKAKEIVGVQKEIEKQRQEQEAERLFLEKSKAEQSTKLAQLTIKYPHLDPLTIKSWLKATSKNKKNEAVRFLANRIVTLLVLKEPWESKDKFLEEFHATVKELKSFLDEFSTEYDPAVRKEIEQQLEEFKALEIEEISQLKPEEAKKAGEEKKKEATQPPSTTTKPPQPAPQAKPTQETQKPKEPVTTKPKTPVAPAKPAQPQPQPKPVAPTPTKPVAPQSEFERAMAARRKKQEEQEAARARPTTAAPTPAQQPAQTQPQPQPKPPVAQPQPKPTPQAPTKPGTKEWDKQLVTFWEKLKKFLAINQNVESTEKSWFDQLNAQQWDVELPQLRGQAYALSPAFDDFLEAFLTDYGATHMAVERKLLIGAVDKVGPFLFGTGPLTAEQKQLVKDVMDPNSATGKKMQELIAQRR